MLLLCCGDNNENFTMNAQKYVPATTFRVARQPDSRIMGTESLNQA